MEKLEKVIDEYLPGWNIGEDYDFDYIWNDFSFKGKAAAINFVYEIFRTIEDKLGHHVDTHIVWIDEKWTVRIECYTHDIMAVTKLDLKIAKAITMMMNESSDGVDSYVNTLHESLDTNLITPPEFMIQLDLPESAYELSRLLMKMTNEDQFKSSSTGEDQILTFVSKAEYNYFTNKLKKLGVNYVDVKSNAEEIKSKSPYPSNNDVQQHW